MPRLIFNCPYIKGSAQNATRRENYVRYISTRGGIELIRPDNADSPVTSRQKELLSNLLRDFPDSRGMFEYEDYRAAPTRGHASELICRIIEEHLHQMFGGKSIWITSPTVPAPRSWGACPVYRRCRFTGAVPGGGGGVQTHRKSVAAHPLPAA
ncbi:hypothetical protein [Anaerotruncus colihominis]|jgi:hypothetical protein|uniref:Uncharacterized protein n=2 Tax=Anaerotruncus colihominis TaxID=169435 RepID=B0PDN4_9FIRM|nr:hypothetical protein [Anaerotruncus colihominis]EDS10586.1 hypothetical protein ANACOL_03188 [Anaerotruncus colihominis DSM 17241]MBS4989182.1 hypothetical protein [Anaerotruncus colihominis]MCQ4735025.1 hypothetical protein [Anaerotruncus colihominis]OUO66894.1 hypothetical protein B5F55_10460 [Anaerotruncus colihominis]OUP70321.1 hypothetical protein B5F11_04735 [Anaerotruncus colihominis]